MASVLALLGFLGHEIRGRTLPPGADLGHRLAELRRRRGLSRAAVATAAEVTDAAVAALEAGQLGHLETLERVALTLGAGLILVPVGAPTSVWSGAAVSSVYQAWSTPPSLLNRLYPLVGGRFHLDPCSPRPDGPVCARIRFTERDDGLSLPWPIGTTFANPPYGAGISAWTAKVRREFEAGCQPIFLLTAARTDTKWWHSDIVGHGDIFLLKGRLSFGDGGAPAPFPSALIVYGADEVMRTGLRQAFPDAWHVSPSIARRG